MAKIHLTVVELLQSQEIRRILRFLIVGVSNTLVSFVTYLVTLALLPKALGTVSLAQVISYTAGILWSYSWNRFWVFGSRNQIAKEGGRFLVVQLSLMLISAALIGLLVDYFNANRVWAWLIVMGGITVLNYVLIRLWAFRDYGENEIHRH